MSMKKRLLACLACVALCLTGCNGDTSEKAPVKTVREVAQSMDVLPKTTTVERSRIELSSYYEGSVFYQVTQLTFPSEGNFESFKVTIGDTVKKGDTLATTQGSVSEKQYENLKSRADSLTKDYEFNLQIKNIELEILKKELDIIYEALDTKKDNWKKDENGEFLLDDRYTAKCKEAGAKYMAIKAKELEIAQLTETYNFEFPYYNKQVKDYKKTMGKNIIKAPFDGFVVGLNNAQNGSYVSPDSSYIAVADPSVICVSCDFLSQSYLKNYKEFFIMIDGKRYEAEYIPIPDDVYKGIVARDETPHSTFVITNPDENVQIGDIAFLVVVRNSAEDVLIVPNESIDTDTAGKYVYVDTAEGKSKRYVTTGLTDGAYTEIKEGLEEGEKVYVGN